MSKTASATTALVTPAGASNISFDKQINTVEQGLALRSDAEKEVKQNRIICIDILNAHGINLHGRPLEPEMLEGVLSNIKVMGPQPKISKLDKDIHNHIRNYDAEIIQACTRKLFKDNLGAKGVAFIEHMQEIYKNGLPQPQIDKQKTAAARTQFKTAFTNFRKSLDDYEDTKNVIDNIKEYVGIVKDIATIGSESTKGRGKK